MLLCKFCTTLVPLPPYLTCNEVDSIEHECLVKTWNFIINDHGYMQNEILPLVFHSLPYRNRTPSLAIWFAVTYWAHKMWKNLMDSNDFEIALIWAIVLYWSWSSSLLDLWTWWIVKRESPKTMIAMMNFSFRITNPCCSAHISAWLLVTSLNPKQT